MLACAFCFELSTLIGRFRQAMALDRPHENYEFIQDGCAYDLAAGQRVFVSCGAVEYSVDRFQDGGANHTTVTAQDILYFDSQAYASLVAESGALYLSSTYDYVMSSTLCSLQSSAPIARRCAFPVMSFTALRSQIAVLQLRAEYDYQGELPAYCRISYHALRCVFPQDAPSEMQFVLQVSDAVEGQLGQQQINVKTEPYDISRFVYPEAPRIERQLSLQLVEDTIVLPLNCLVGDLEFSYADGQYRLTLGDTTVLETPEPLYVHDYRLIFQNRSTVPDSGQYHSLRCGQPPALGSVRYGNHEILMYPVLSELTVCEVLSFSYPYSGHAFSGSGIDATQCSFNGTHVACLFTEMQRGTLRLELTVVNSIVLSFDVKVYTVEQTVISPICGVYGAAGEETLVFPQLRLETNKYEITACSEADCKNYGTYLICTMRSTTFTIKLNVTVTDWQELQQSYQIECTTQLGPENGYYKPFTPEKIVGNFKTIEQDDSYWEPAPVQQNAKPGVAVIAIVSAAAVVVCIQLADVVMALVRLACSCK